MDIDVGAGTVMTGYDGDPDAVEHLQVRRDEHRATTCDPARTRAGHRRRRRARRAVGADASARRRSTAVEINKDIIGTVNGRFGDFTGHLDRDPRVRFVNDEARSFIARSRRALRTHPDLADRHLGGDRGRRVRPQRELALHRRGLDDVSCST